MASVVDAFVVAASVAASVVDSFVVECCFVIGLVFPDAALPYSYGTCLDYVPTRVKLASGYCWREVRILVPF